jgi:hypothetical protein
MNTQKSSQTDSHSPASAVDIAHGGEFLAVGRSTVGGIEVFTRGALRRQTASSSTARRGRVGATLHGTAMSALRKQQTHTHTNMRERSKLQQ